MSVDKEGERTYKPSEPTMSAHAQPSLIVNQSLHRLPLILDILDEIDTGAKQPGDDDLRRGSLLAVYSMMERLQRIEPLNLSVITATPSDEEQIATGWLLGERPRKLLPPTLYGELSSLIQRLIPANAGIANGQAGYPT